MLAIATGFVVLVPIAVALIERRPKDARDWWWIFAKQLANALGLILLMVRTAVAKQAPRTDV